MSFPTADLHAHIEAKIDAFLKAQEAKPDTAKRVLIGVGIMFAASLVVEHVVLPWLF